MGKKTNITRLFESQSEAVPTKICKSCGKELPATLEYFTKTKQCRYGVAPRCKECVNSKNREARRINGLTKKDLQARKNFIFDENNNPIKRKCTKCHKVKVLDDFYDEKNGYFGKMAKCKACFKILMDDRRDRNIANVVHVDRKVCTKCNKEKPISEFYANAASPDGKTVVCIDCEKKHHREYYIANTDMVTERVKRYRTSSRGKKKRAEWENNNKERHAEYRANPKNKEVQKRWWARNPHKPAEYRKRKLSTPKGALDARMSRTIYRGLKHGTNGAGWRALVPYSIDELYEHLSKTMPDGYTWQDYQDGELHLDHKIPLAAFPYETSDNINFQKAWSLENLQLLPALDNLKKWAKLEKPFQPYLGFTLNV